MGKVSSSLGTCILGKVHRAEWAGVGAASERRGKSFAAQKQRLQKACFGCLVSAGMVSAN